MTQPKLPPDFLWGFATAAYQIEGAVHNDGRKDSIWDTFCREPGKIADGSSGDVACDSYRRTAEDIALLKSLGARVYRFSLSWSRIIPLGGRDDPVNERGLQHYVKFVEDLRAADIEPFVTLYHWDLPDNLEKRYGGLLNKDEFVEDFTNYAKVVFDAMGDRVKYWITFNEPWCMAVHGYNNGVFAPGRTSDRTKSPEGDGAREPWIVAHNTILAHGSAVKLFREQHKPKYGGQIAITLNGDWCEPWDSSDPKDVEACERKQEFFIGWFADPVYFGDYPISLRKQLGDRLPTFSEEEAVIVKGSNDYYGMNHYCANYIKHRKGEPPQEDILGNVEMHPNNKAGHFIGPETQSSWLRPYPIGFRKLLKWISDRYGRPTIFVTENGTSIKGENELPVEQLLEDDFRAQFFRDYIAAMVDAYTEDNVDVRGYMAWSLLDNFEWADGYETRFGVTYVDYHNGQQRFPKKSAKVIGQVFESLIRRDSKE